MKTRKPFLFAAGGLSYVGLELLWRGRSHSSMFLAGGSCFLLLGTLDRARRLPLSVRITAGAGIITAVELLTGFVVNRDFAVWDYRDMPLNYRGQICLPFSLLWIPLSALAERIYGRLEKG